MKRILSALLLLLLVCALAAPVLADVAYEPDDAFFRRHSIDCHYENRGYYTNGADGCVLVYEAPGGAAKTALANGVLYYVYYTYESDDCLWGQMEYNPDDPADRENWRNFVSGWVPMAEMTAEYDNSSFFAEHGDEYIQKDTMLTWGGNDTVYAYKYPGSGIVVDVFEGGWTQDPMTFSSVFVDPAGREWGHMGYYYGSRNFWVCLDDPFNGALEPDENYRSVETVPAASAEVMAEALEQAAAPNLYLYAGAAGVVIIAAAVLVFVLRRRTRA